MRIELLLLESACAWFTRNY